MDAQQKLHAWNAEKDEMMTTARAEMKCAETKHNEHVRGLRSGFRREHEANEAMRLIRTDYEELSSALAECSDWRERFESRESRHEDLEKIAELKKKVKSAEKRVHAVQEEMKYFKLELLNREESFNKMFNASPNVGVMNVVKPKGGLPAKGRNKSGRSPSVSSKNGFSPVEAAQTP